MSQPRSLDSATLHPKIDSTLPGGVTKAIADLNASTAELKHINATQRSVSLADIAQFIGTISNTILKILGKEPNHL